MTLAFVSKLKFYEIILLQFVHILIGAGFLAHLTQRVM
jgi:hypothetical protein